MHSLESVHALDTLLNSLHTQKANLLHQLEQIDADIAAAGRKRAKICNDAALVSKLPPELLSHIFLLCQKDKPAFRLIATRVCSRWRDLAVGTRMLWTDIRISLAHYLHVQSGLDKMETYLSRSGPSSLFDVRLDIDDVLDYAPFLKLIANHIERCSHLSVSVLAVSVRQRTSAACLLFREHLELLWAPHLSHLSLHVDSGDGYEITMCGTPSILKAGAPSLSHLQLTGYATGLQPPISGGITTLYLDGMYMTSLTVLEYRDMLATNRCLVNLSLQWFAIDSSMSTDSRTVELPMLRSLRIRTEEGYSGSNEALLNALPLSRLESLILYDFDDLFSFEFPNVKDLSLYNCEFLMDQTVIEQLVLAFPSIIRLTLELYSGPFLYAALSILGEPMTWPKLRTLCVKELDIIDDSDDFSALSRLVQARSRVNSPLDFLYLDNSSHRRAVDILRALGTPTKIICTDIYPAPWPPGSDMNYYDNFWED
ncbi:hypothetical protein F5878DRAFT_431285 [Lentinula raphanica]|uniref:F-box domain-containing protein n=1 Tax=Lentinula raphanica TaxID=153919 RepID=A0AA38PFI4_9AGAR|nr:hypothetical protein F5878DRAFT_431285 [Lentinula raphanica]